MPVQLPSSSLYLIAWIAALSKERAAATALLDERHDSPLGFRQHPSDTNSYSWGRIGQHNVVIACLPAGIYGTVSATTTACNLLSSLPHIRIGLMVGIGGAVSRPDLGRDIRLGDVVVSQPDGKTGGVVQYDFGVRTHDQTFERRGSLSTPPPILLAALARLQAEHELRPSRMPLLLEAMREAYPSMAQSHVHQGVENDRLFCSAYCHPGGKRSTCDGCDTAHSVPRKQRGVLDPQIHYGVIGSGNTLFKDSVARDKLGEDIICVEMEAAGLMDRFPCLVIRGMCDYADSHKNDRWQPYASATAAAYAKELLGFVSSKELQVTPPAIDAVRLG